MKRRAFCLAGAAGLLGRATAPARAETWPGGPIRFVVGYAPGGTSDVSARVVGEALSERVKQPVVVENRPGAQGGIALDTVARAKPDGYTFLVSPGEAIYQRALERNTTVEAACPVTPVTILTSQPLVLVANGTRGWKSIPDVIAAARAQPDRLSYATPSAGPGTNAIVAEEIFRKAKVKVIRVPYKGGGQAVQDLLSDVVPLAVLGSAPVIPYAASGKLTLLAVTSKERDPTLPTVPAMAELGYPEIDVSQWFALFAPPETPKEIVDSLSGHLLEVLRDPKVVKSLGGAALSPVGGTPEAFTRRLSTEGKQWLDAIRAFGLDKF